MIQTKLVLRLMVAVLTNSKFETSQMTNPVLENVTFIDTPGVLSGEKQRIGRAYDYVRVAEWFADKADLILLLFDAHKLDISDEFKRVITGIKDHDEKIRIVLNKADCVEQQQLMRVFGLSTSLQYANSPTIDVQVRRTHVVAGQGIWHTRGQAGLH